MHYPRWTRPARLSPVLAAVVVCAVNAALAGPATAADGAEAVTFNRDIQPILVQHCFACHGPDAEARKAGLRLDDRAAAMQALSSGSRAIVANDPEASELVHRIFAEDDDEVMPPPSFEKPLTAEQKQLLSDWVAQGAIYEEHWSYVVPERPEPPQPQQHADRVRNVIDAFVLARLEDEQLMPAAEADRYTLARRLYLDLTGLPPTIEQVDAFVHDERPDAYERLVDRLLARPAYGEHMARDWLDVARYADTHGYHVDTKRSIWPYRDWVIEAFNRNMPFDQFTIEQIAGDLLPEPTLDQRIATGFHRNTMFNEEGGIDPEEFRTKAVVDRVNTTLTAWMGVTIGCAECHDHKYDPISQREFYQLYAFFNNVPETGGEPDPSQAAQTPARPILELPLPEAKQQELDAARAELASLRDYQPDGDTLAAWGEQVLAEQPIAWRVLSPATVESAEGVTLSVLDDASVRAGEERPAKDVVTVTAVVEPGARPITAIRLEALADERDPAGGPGRQGDGNFVLSEFTLAAAPVEDADAARELALREATATHDQQNFASPNAIDGDAATGWAIHPEMGRDHHAVFQLAEPLAVDRPTRLTFELQHNYGNTTLLGRFRLAVTDAQPPVTADTPGIPADVLAILRTAEADRTDADRQRLIAHYLATQPHPHAERIEALEQRIAELEDSRPHTLVMEEMDEPRETRIHKRGNFLDPGERVQPNVPAVFHPIEARGERPDRLDLARWLVDERNPLTARVTMNRLWQQFFGHGLVRTPEDFGTPGLKPTHPELLDYLATEFVASDWDTQHMIRLMVTSSTYRQAAAADSDKLERDPDNRLLSRGPRFRLDAEVIRDLSLSAAGILNRRIGGPSVYPKQPPGLWEEKGLTGFGMGTWPTSEGTDLYRRGMYTFWRRSVHYPSFDSFDAPSREFCVVQRPRTNTPLQALITLNEEPFIEAARVFAERILTEGGDTLDARLTFAFRTCVARPPTDRELRTLRELHDDRLAYFRDHPEEAEQLRSRGPAPQREGLDDVDVATWTVIGNVLLNLDETITKG